ncbi:MAG: hypothetical protein HY671_14780 [Chloroflexi bacterium]|nr:hypothetical protein [Chloroflexota bacterium]
MSQIWGASRATASRASRWRWRRSSRTWGTVGPSVFSNSSQSLIRSTTAVGLGPDHPVFR